MTSLNIGDRTVGDGHPCYVIAEACVNHNGDMKIAIALADAAKSAGADAVKYQLHYPEHEMLREVPASGNFDKPLWEILEETNLTDDQHVELMDHCRAIGIQYLCTAYCREAGDYLASIGLLAYKTGSGETLNHPLLRALAQHRKPLLVSTGMATLQEVDDTVDVLRSTGNSFAIFHCTSEYPPAYEDINLGLIPFYKERYGVPVGHSDHCPNIYTALGAVALGANLIEKHFTLDRSQPGVDQPVSLEPAELTQLVTGIRALEAASGSRKDIFERERPIRAWAHHSVVTLRVIHAGETIDESAVWVKRPGTGIPAARLTEVVGRRAGRDIPASTLVTWDDLE